MQQVKQSPKPQNMETADQVAELFEREAPAAAGSLQQKINQAGGHHLLIVGSKLSPKKPIIVARLVTAHNRGNAHDPNWLILLWSWAGGSYLWDQDKHGGHTEIITEDELIEMLEGC